MSNIIVREATHNDIPFLVDTIMEAEKSGTDKLTYSTIFGLSEAEARKCVAEMLREEVDGCELSVSSFLLAESESTVLAAVGAWIEELEGVPSSVIKGNLLNFTLPKSCIERAVTHSAVGRDLHIEYIPKTIQIGLVYVSEKSRGMNLTGRLIESQINRFLKIIPTLKEVYVQVFGGNKAAIRAYEKANFKIVLTKKATLPETIQFMPWDTKVLMRREI